MRSGLGSAFTFMLGLDTLGAFAGAPGTGPFLPPPRMYLATWVLYSLLGFLAGVGPRAARFATRLGWLIVLGAMLGKYGRLFIAALNRTAQTVAPTDSTTP
jgi:hypothetical protein